MRSIRTLDVIATLAVAALTVSTLLPAIGRIQRSPSEVRCQSNLQRWAEALELYCIDYTGRYPTNRLNSASKPLTNAAALSPPDPLPGQTEPPIQYYSINWIEALYGYVQKSARQTDQDWKTFRRCPNVSTKVWPTPIFSTDYPYSSVSYTFNYNLAEYWSGLVRDPRRVMMMREYFLTTIALLRPMNVSRGSSTARPQYAFNNGDQNATSAENSDPATWKAHGDGSYVVFVDGHVHHFGLDYYPKYEDMTTQFSWDPETQQWWNFAPGSGKTAPYLKSIAVTP